MTMTGNKDIQYATQSKSVLKNFMDLPMPSDKIQCMYVWIDGSGGQLCAKTKTLDFVPTTVKDVPIWTTCTYPTFHKSLDNCEIYLQPVALYKDPFRKNENKIVLCETYFPDHVPTASNNRRSCAEIMEKAKNLQPWFGFEQEYMLLNSSGLPLGGIENGIKAPSGKGYFGVGADRVFGRDIQEAHYRACLYAGVEIAGTNAEFMPAQFEFQIGICKGISIGDDLWMARFLLQRIAEEFGVIATIDSKPFIDNWLGNGCHANFSTNKMRDANGIREIERTIAILAKNNEEDLKRYDLEGGKDNLRRLTGIAATPDYHNFSSGVATRGGSARIPRHVADNGRGYFEDRRPSSKCDPYCVAEVLVRAAYTNE